MKSICISPKAQATAGTVVVVVTGALIAAQLPEIRRYLAMRSM
jgi:hypothetical protein